MKKKLYLKSIYVLLLLTYLLSSCEQENPFSIPIIETQENKDLLQILDSIERNPNWSMMPLQDLKNQFTTGSEPFQITSHLVIKGYVVSSDESGNFFKEFYLQDHPTQPTASFKIVLNLTNSYNRFNIGREVYLYLKDLYIGETISGDGVTAIGGKLDGDEIEVISQNQLPTHLFRTTTTENIIPLPMTFAAINQSHIGLFVEFNEVHFSEDSKRKPYVDQLDDFDTQRIMIGCEGFDFTEFLLETSTFAVFKNELLPEKGGRIAGIITKTYNGNAFILALNTPKDVEMENEICEVINIETYDIVLLEENFEDTAGVIAIPGWTNFNEQGTKLWQSYTDEDSGSKAAKIGSFFSGNDATVSWLITKGISLNSVQNAFLSFETSNSFADGSELEVLISSNWNGELTSISSATWEILPAIIAKDSDSYEQWIHSSYVSLAAYTGTIYIAFKYIGNGNEAFDGTFELDTIQIIGN